MIPATIPSGSVPVGDLIEATAFVLYVRECFDVFAIKRPTLVDVLNGRRDVPGLRRADIEEATAYGRWMAGRADLRKQKALVRMLDKVGRNPVLSRTTVSAILEALLKIKP